MSDDPNSVNTENEDELDDLEEPEVAGLMKFDPVGSIGSVPPLFKPPTTGTPSPGSTTPTTKPGTDGTTTTSFPGPA